MSLGMALAMILGGVLQAKVYHADTMKEFVKDLRRGESGLSYVLFYSEEKKIDKDVRNQIKDLLDDFKDVSNEEDNVRFISVNLAREKAGEIKNRYARYAGGQMPFFLLFKNGSTIPFKVSEKVVSMTGFVDRKAMRSFLYQSFEKEIKAAVKVRQKEREERRRARWYYGPSFYLGWDSPYYYGYPYYPYSYGWGGRWGWGW